MDGENSWNIFEPSDFVENWELVFWIDSTNLDSIFDGENAASSGSFSGNELVTVTCYVLGLIGGAVAGAMFGWWVHSRRDSR